jgi:hypothetical protein
MNLIIMKMMVTVININPDEDDLDYDENYNEDYEEDLLSKAFTAQVNVSEIKKKETNIVVNKIEKPKEEKPKEVVNPIEEKPKEEKTKKNKLDGLFSK